MLTLQLAYVRDHVPKEVVMVRSRLFWISAFSLLSQLALGCADGRGAAEPQGDAGGGGSGGSACAPPDGAEIVLPWTSFASGDGATVPAYGLLTDGTSLFVNYYERIVKIPLAGGMISEVYRSPATIPLGLAMWADESGLVVFDAESWVLVPYAGGASVPLTLAMPRGGRVFDWNPASDTFLVAWEDFEAGTMNVDAITLDGGRTSLVTGVRQGLGNRRWVQGGDMLYVMGERVLGGASDDTIYRFSAPAYAAEALTLSPIATDLIGADSGSFYFSSLVDTSSWGLYRQSHTGSSAERITNEYWIGGMAGWNGDGSAYVNDATHLWRVGESGPAEQLATVPSQSCTTHEVLGYDGWVYTSTFNSSSGENQVWRIRE